MKTLVMRQAECLMLSGIFMSTANCILRKFLKSEFFRFVIVIFNEILRLLLFDLID